MPFAPGGASDSSARVIAPRLAEMLGQPVVIENRAGAGGTIGTIVAAKSTPDGHTLLLGSSTEIVLNPNLYDRLPYDTVRDFTPVTLLSSTPLLLVAHPVVPAPTVAALLQLTRKQPGRLNYATSGNGSSGHMAAELLRSMTGIDIVHIPFQSGSAGVASLLNGQVDIMFSAMPNVVGQVHAGRLRAIAITTLSRSPALPDVRTMGESGLVDYDIAIWNGMFTPVGVTRDIISKLHEALLRTVALPDTRESFSRFGADPVTSTPEQFSAYVKAELARWAAVVKATGARLN